VIAVARRSSDPDFIEALARGLDVIRAFRPNRPVMTLSEVATEAGLARPTARRILLTLEELGYARADENGFALTPRIMELGVAYVRSTGLWEIARPHMEWLVARTHQSSSIAQLDGSDIVYVARVAVPKIVTLRVDIGTRFPAAATSVLAEPGRSGVQPSASPCEEELAAALREVRAKGWALTDQQLAPAIRSVAAPLRDGSGRVIAALNVNAHAAETSLLTLVDDYLPLLLQAAGEISADWARHESVPYVTAG
jgi:IclR family pca regulon transcriptional regulator